ncbi:MAG TPA: type IV pilus twitching motility protein PilT [Blastocatellia bacterium]|nr:type IV pilus twitching motility protein PilT [Blastocatellia bacterium]
MMKELSLTAMLRELIERGGSDLHLTENSPPMVRVHGGLQPLNYEPLEASQIQHVVFSLLTDKQKTDLEAKQQIDYSFGVKGMSRFRSNVFYQRGAVGAVYRAIPFEIRSFEDLGLPAAIQRMCEKPRGLVLVTGPTGSGKSTTLAAMIDKINRERHDHIITVEDPIEFIHSHKNCIVNQREVGTDAPSFDAALRAALRQDPDVVLIGEMRDLETTETALRIAETGHLTFATLHTNSAASSITRIIDIFPAAQQAQIRVQLAMVLEGIVTQSLLPTKGGDGRALALEVLVPTPAIRNLIREEKVHQIYSMMQTSTESGMITFNQSLANLAIQGKVAREMALSRSSNVDELNELLARKGNRGGGGQPALGSVSQPRRAGEY